MSRYDENRRKSITKRVGGVAAVARFDSEGRLFNVDIHRTVTDGERRVDEQKCCFLGSAACQLSDSPLGDLYEGQVLSVEQVDGLLRDAIWKELSR